ncbi:NUDIX hydrolase [Hippea jasoniae]|uniref:NUDIX hydrolase n=1 Tax=Hippea jasoniae TaxID=944479 RepID=UPI000552159E|nr:CoA pyrophosphatase [Hippea jasoniae]
MIDEKTLKKLFSQSQKITISNPNLKKAAVIIPFLKSKDDWLLIFEKKPSSSTTHPDQISFPGGSWEKSDKNFAHTALRETCEELNICGNDIELLGPFEPMRTLTTNFLIYPFGGIVKKQPPYNYNPDEVVKLLFIPFDFFIKNHPFERKNYSYKGKNRQTFIIEYKGEIIWGATARILDKLVQKLKLLL